MKTHKAFKHALNMVLHSKLRSWLTILGIVIGVAAVISIMSIGAGLQQQVSSQLNALGGDLLTVSAGASRAGGHGWGRSSQSTAKATDEEVVLDRTDFQAIKGLSDIAYIDTNIRGSADAYYLGKEGSVSVIGVDPAVWAQVTTTELAEGRMLGPADSNTIVIGGALAADFFENPLGVNQLLQIESKNLQDCWHT